MSEKVFFSLLTVLLFGIFVHGAYQKYAVHESHTPAPTQEANPDTVRDILQGIVLTAGFPDTGISQLKIGPDPDEIDTFRDAQGYVLHLALDEEGKKKLGKYIDAVDRYLTNIGFTKESVRPDMNMTVLTHENYHRDGQVCVVETTANTTTSLTSGIIGCYSQ